MHVCQAARSDPHLRAPTLAPQARLQQVQDEWQRENAAAARTAADAAVATVATQREEIEALRRALDERDAELAERGARLAQLQGKADEGVRARAAREAALQVQLEEARCVVLQLGFSIWQACMCTVLHNLSCAAHSA